MMPSGYTVVISGCVGCLLFFSIFSKVRPKLWEENEFELFINKYNKSYTNETEYYKRLMAFKKTLETIDVMNKHRTYQTSALYGITAFSDLYEEEFVEARLQKNYAERMSSRQYTNEFGFKRRSDVESEKEKRRRFGRYSPVGNLPRKIDWRSRGAVTPVNNQRECGACWAFSAIETIESMHWMKTGELRALSTQQMIDCARNGNHGCRGGDICTLFQWLAYNDVPIRRAEEYPLHLKDEQCKKMPQNASEAAVRVASTICVEMVGAEDDLLAGIASVGPVAVAVNALSWQNYLGGVIQHHCAAHPSLMNHAVQIVGYDLDAEIPHYIVRNSWGEEFGHAGYLQVAIGDNLCGIANEVATVQLL